MRITKAIFPVGGLGTRFLPATKAAPKEMLTIVDKPLIQYAVEEALAAGIEEIIFVTSIHKRSIEDHFDKNYELEDTLMKKGKYELLEIVKNIVPDNLHCVYVRQKEALGLGHAVLCAQKLIAKDEHFAVILADDLIYSKSAGCLTQMVNFAKQKLGGVIAVQNVPKSTVDQYGIVGVSKDNTIVDMVEKPDPSETNSSLAVVGRYILHSDIFTYLRDQKAGVGNEIQLTDAIANSLGINKVYAYEFSGKRYDCGDKLGFMIANHEYAKRHELLGESFCKYLDQENSG
jgi:UTP--glucose-1-phosphate uridylyltransferase